MADKAQKKANKAEEAAAAAAAAAEAEAKTSVPVPLDVLPLNLSKKQKAAAVIVSLGTEKASTLYQHLAADDLENLTIEVARLGFIDSATTESVLNEFYQMCLTNKAVTEGGYDYARSVLENAFGSQAAESLLEKVTSALMSKDFDFLGKVDEKSLFSALQHERPQTIALILSYAPSGRAASVIEQLDAKKQVKVIESIANMESASPSAIKIIEEELEKNFSALVRTGEVDIGGVDYVAEIMNNLDRASEKSIFDHLGKTNETLAEEIRKRMFTFEDIVTMDDRSVQRFVRDCDPKDIVLALKGAGSEVANKIFANMSTRMAQSIKDDLEVTTNVRMRDAEEAQQRVVGVIRSLEERNELIILKGGKDDIIV